MSQGLDVALQSPHALAVHILTLAGSLQKKSANRTLLSVLAEHAISRNERTLHFEQWQGLGDLPLYNPDLDNDSAPWSAAEWRRKVEKANALVIACPEYAHSLPGAVKNAVDWIVSSGELVDKPVAITCATRGPGRGLRGLAALEQTLRAVDARLIWNQPTLIPHPFPEANRGSSDLLQTLDRLLERLSNSATL